MAKKSVFVGFLVFGFCVLLIGSGQAFRPNEVQSQFKALEKHWDQATQVGSDYREVIELLGCLAHVPGILTTDSQKAWAVKSSAVLAMMATDTKIFAELFKHSDGCLAKQCVYNIPKTTLYALASYYDYVRVMGEVTALPADSSALGHMRWSKITQFFQLGIEIFLRVMACIDKYDNNTLTQGNRAWYLSEAADWIELWRLIGRFGVLSDQDATFPERLGKIKQSLAEKLNALSTDLAKKSIEAK